jgi:hypothetical protein
MRQTSMKENPRFKQITELQNNLAANAPKSRARQKSRMTKRLAPQRAEPVQPSRGLLICLGWLRLFQQIVAPSYAMAARRGTRHVR